MSFWQERNATSLIDRMQPHWRLATAVGLGLLIAVQPRLSALLPGLAYGLILFLCARQVRPAVLRRLVWINLVVTGLAACLALGAGGQVMFRFGRLTVTDIGLQAAAAVVVKCNAVLLITVSLLGNLAPLDLGRCLRRLHVPGRLVTLSFLMLRYADVLHDEYLVLRRCLCVRGFRIGLSRHHLRAVGYLVGNLLLRSFERGERLLQAMHCRGFHGEFPRVRPETSVGYREYALVLTAVASAGLTLWQACL